MKFAKIISAVALLACSAAASAQYTGTVPGTEYVYEVTSLLGVQQQPLIISAVEKAGDTTTVTQTLIVDVPQQPDTKVEVPSYAKYTTPDAPTIYEACSARQMKDLALNIVRPQLEANHMYSDSLIKQVEQYLLIEGEAVLILDPKATLGDDIPESSIIVNMGPIRIVSKIADGSVLGTETVTVPAGTFENCLKVIYNNVTSVMGEVSVKMATMAWYATGVGMVKSEIRSEEGTVISTTELKQIKTP